MLQVFRDLLLAIDLHSNDNITFNIQSKLLYSVNNWVINDFSHITTNSIITVYPAHFFASPSDSCRFFARSRRSFIHPSHIFCSK